MNNPHFLRVKNESYAEWSASSCKNNIRNLYLSSNGPNPVPWFFGTVQTALYGLHCVAVRFLETKFTILQGSGCLVLVFFYEQLEEPDSGSIRLKRVKTRFCKKRMSRLVLQILRRCYVKFH